MSVRLKLVHHPVPRQPSGATLKPHVGAAACDASSQQSAGFLGPWQADKLIPVAARYGTSRLTPLP